MSDPVVNRTVTVSIGPDGVPTHAWQITTFAVVRDGVEVTRYSSDKENVKPDDIGKVIPQAEELALGWERLRQEVANRDEALAALSKQRDALVEKLKTIFSTITTEPEPAAAAK